MKAGYIFLSVFFIIAVVALVIATIRTGTETTMTNLELEAFTKKVYDCMNVMEIPTRNGGPGYDERSRNFITDISTRLENGQTSFSQKQIQWVGNLYDRI